MVMNIALSNYFLSALISSLAWYHNGTRLTPDDRINITNNGTKLTILSMADSDAGKYEVKINSIQFEDRINSDFCDGNILPMLENMAVYSPVTFLLQDPNMAMCNPEDVISEYILPDLQGTHRSININNVLNINANAVLSVSGISEMLFKDTVSIRDEGTYNSTVSYDNITTLSLRMTYNGADDITGHYIHVAYANYRYLDRMSCDGYYYFVGTFIPIFTFYWNVRTYSKLNYIGIVP